MSARKGTTLQEQPAPRRLSIEQILTAKDVVEEDIYIPEWGGTLRIRSFTKADQAAYRDDARDPDTGEVDAQAIEMFMFIRGVIDPRFTPAHFDELRKKGAGPIDRVINRLVEISGFGKKAVEAAEKTFSEG